MQVRRTALGGRFTGARCPADLDLSFEPVDLVFDRLPGDNELQCHKYGRQNKSRIIENSEPENDTGRHDLPARSGNIGGVVWPSLHRFPAYRASIPARQDFQANR